MCMIGYAWGVSEHAVNLQISILLGTNDDRSIDHKVLGYPIFSQTQLRYKIYNNRTTGFYHVLPLSYVKSPLGKIIINHL